MQKQNSESGDSTIDISAIKDALKKLDYNPNFQRILESQINFEIENEEEQLYVDDINWLIEIARRMCITNAISKLLEKDKYEKIIELSNDIYSELYEVKSRPKLRLIK